MATLEQRQVTIEERHLDRAIKERDMPEADIVRVCVFTQAVNEALDGEYVTAENCVQSTVSNNRFGYGPLLYTAPGSEDIVKLFDRRHYDELRRKLPVTLTLYPVP
jgi:hypothetical protein